MTAQFGLLLLLPCILGAGASLIPLQGPEVQFSEDGETWSNVTSAGEVQGYAWQLSTVSAGDYYGVVDGNGVIYRVSWDDLSASEKQTWSSTFGTNVELTMSWDSSLVFTQVTQ